MIRDRDALDEICDIVGIKKAKKFDHSYLKDYNPLDDRILRESEPKKEADDNKRTPKS